MIGTLTDPLLAVLILAVVVVALALAIIVSRRSPIVVPAQPVAVRVNELEDRLDVFESHLKEQDGTMERQDHDLRNIRMMLQSVPTKDAVHQIDIKVTSLDGKVATVEATSSANGRTLERIENFLLNSKFGSSS